MSDADLRVGFIGSGYIAGVHAAALQRIEGVCLTACMDVDESQTRALAAWTGCAPHTEVAPVLEQCDAAWVCSPPTFHREHVIACLEAGVHVYCEKPLAGSLEDGVPIVRRAADASALAAIGFNFRFCDAWRKCSEIVKSGELGDVVMFAWQRLDGPPGPGWRLDPELMVGMAIESVSHDLDLARWLLGEVSHVAAHVVASDPERPAFDDCLSAVVRLRSGVTGSVQASWASSLAASRHSIIGTEGAVSVEGPRPFRLTRVRAAMKGATPEHVYHYAAGGQGHAEACAHFVRAIREGAALEIPIAEGLRALEVSVALHESSAAGGASVEVLHAG